MTPIKLSTDIQRQEVIQHLLSLDREDLRLRFGYMPSDEAVTKYVTSSWNKPRNQWFGVYSPNEDGCIATLHTAVLDNLSAELGCTVKKEYRKQGIGDKLFLRGVTWAKSHGVREIYMHCLSENKAIQKIAKKNDMKVVTICYDEAEATLKTDLDVTAPFVDVFLDRIAIYDMLLINQQKIISKFLGVNNE